MENNTKDIIKRVVDNISGIDADIVSYITIVAVNPSIRVELYNMFKEKIDEFVDIYGLKEVENWEKEIYMELFRRRTRSRARP